jgi:3-phenylpropionate/trans-cinnamate dioxygenase ferredoxin subunit
MADLVFVPIARADLAPGQVRVVTHAGWRYAVCNVNGTYHVVDDTCTHDDGPLGEGTLDGCAIVCPRHGARFDVRDGRVLSMPAASPIRSYSTRVEEGQVEVGFTQAQLARETHR